MEKKFKKEVTPEERLTQMRKLIKPFIKKYGKPIIVHSTPNSVNFKIIINDEEIRVPDVKTANRKPHIESMFGLYPSVFFSLGFQYASGYKFKYSLIFSLDFLKETKYYQRSISFQAYKKTALFWDKHNPEYLIKLSKKNKLSKSVVDKFYNESYNGKKKSMFDFWKCENEIFDLIRKYPRKDELVKIYREIAKERFISYPKSLIEANKDYSKEYAPEIISLSNVDLINNKYFLGFYIDGKIPKDIEKMLKTKYLGKILFDGKNIKVLTK